MAFFRSWTRREAIMKATGQGLGGLSDDFDASHAEHSTSSPTQNGDPYGATSRWSLRDLTSPQGYAAAAAVAVHGDTCPRWQELSFDHPGASRTIS
jgi:4'-phosphopantetheinyl transferase